MKIVITSEGPDLNSIFDLRFGRAAYFCVFDTTTGESEFISNEFVDAKGGAGTRSAEKMLELKVEKVVSGDFGPNAKDVLQRLNVQMIILPDNGKTIKEITEDLKSRS